MTTYTFDVMEAAEWGMRWARPPVATTNPSPFGYQHHTAGNTMAALRDENGNGLNADEAFRRINEMAIGEDMSAIDYTALVHESESGRVTVGIARGPWLPAATYKSNDVSKAVCAMGFFHPGHELSSQPSAGMLEGCALAWAELHRRGWVTRDAIRNLRGHRQNPYSIGAHATACPGDYLFPHVPAIGSRALELVDGAPAPPPPDPTPTPPPPLPPTEEVTDMWLAIKTRNPDGTQGPWLASSGLRAGAVHVPSQVTLDQLFDAGNGRVFAVGYGVITEGSWGAVPAKMTEADAAKWLGSRI